ncbi:uncharacterized protein LOC121877729 [Homarus americanus]|uniref:uncharacterized protein LOC121877729 n=1 Tax=Homarus americanus TaxID=6706 RepID=UPI001C45CCC8|nr:uncharacterized protein LOC121877729 [Homarus americanus]
MKSFLVLLCFVALAWSQERPECWCGAFVTLRDLEFEVLHLPPIDVDGCEDFIDCHHRCTAEWTFILDDGDLDHELIDGKTAGQHMCDNLVEEGTKDLPPHQVYLYYQLCSTPWLFDGQTSQNSLCCLNGTYHHCP